MASCRVMVVDDNVDAANVVALAISTLGHEVQVAHSAKDALVLVESFDYEVGILDLGMTEMDGLQLCRRLRARTRVPRPYLVALTGWGRRDDRQRTFEAGFDEHWTKPADMERLRQLLDRWPIMASQPRTGDEFIRGT